MGLQGGAWHGTSGNATANKTHGQSMQAICGQIGGVEVALSTMGRDVLAGGLRSEGRGCVGDNGASCSMDDLLSLASVDDRAGRMAQKPGVVKVMEEFEVGEWQL